MFFGFLSVCVGSIVCVHLRGVPVVCVLFLSLSRRHSHLLFQGAMCFLHSVIMPVFNIVRSALSVLDHFMLVTWGKLLEMV